MKKEKSRGAIAAIIAVLVVCGGSFFAVKAMTSRSKPQTTQQPMPVQPVIQTVYTVISEVVPSSESTQPTTEPSQQEEPTVASTYPDDETSTTEPTTEEPTAPTTTVPTTTLPSTTLPSTTLPTAPPTAPPTTAAPATNPPVSMPSTTKDANINQAANQNQGFLSYIFNPDGHFYYTADDPWQRNFGFNSVYDDLAGFVFIYYDTVRIKFPYDSKDWMIQFWKGQYGGVFIGAEIGVYNKPQSRATEHYDCANNNDCLHMSMTCLRNGEEIFSREYASYWWCTGFVPGRLKSFRDRSELTVRARITAKDRTMLKAFVSGLNNAGFKYKTNYYVDGLDMYIIW